VITELTAARARFAERSSTASVYQRHAAHSRVPGVALNAVDRAAEDDLRIAHRSDG
jgi:hypothetical protein